MAIEGSVGVDIASQLTPSSPFADWATEAQEAESNWIQWLLVLPIMAAVVQPRLQGQSRRRIAMGRG